MHPVLKHLIETDFRDLKGSSIQGQIVISDEFVNQGIQDLLTRQSDTSPSEESDNKEDAVESAMPSPAELLKHIHIEKIEFRSEAGKSILELKASR